MEIRTFSRTRTQVAFLSLVKRCFSFSTSKWHLNLREFLSTHRQRVRNIYLPSHFLSFLTFCD